MSQSAKALILLTATVFLGAFGQIFLKVGVQKVGGIHMTWPISGELVKIFTSPILMLGFLFYVFSAYLTLAALSAVDLSVFSIFTCLSYIIILTASYFLFHEPFPPMRLFGSLLALVGVYLMMVA